MAIAAPTAGNRIVTTDLAAFFNLLKGVTGSGETITLIYNAAGVITFQPSSDPATGTELFQIKNTAGTVQMALSSDGKVYAADGTAPLPGMTWEQDKDTGVYRITANTLGFSAGGTEKMRIDGTGVSLDGGSTYLSSSTALPTQMFWYWMPGVAVENTNTGTGAYTTPTNASYGLLSCGATSGSNCGLRKFAFIGSFGTGLSGTFKVRQWSFLFATDKAASEAARLFITDESVTGQPSLTARHMGIKWDGTTASFSTADGATEQTTDITANITASTDHRALVTFDGTTAKLFLDGTLRATHATNVPTSNTNATPTFRAHITNSTAADKLLYVGPQSVWMAP